MWTCMLFMFGKCKMQRVNIYQKALTPIFGEELHIIYDEDYDDCIIITLDGEKEDFGFALYGGDSLRLYWCNECFIFDKARNLLVSLLVYEVMEKCLAKCSTQICYNEKCFVPRENTENGKIELSEKWQWLNGDKSEGSSLFTEV